MKRSQANRANAVPETALVIALVLLVLFGAVQQAIFAFYQVSADGASFMGAQKAVALKGAAATQSNAQNIAASLFTRIAKSSVIAAAGTSPSGQPLFETDVVTSVPTLSLPGFPATIPIQSRTVEPGVGTPAPLICGKNTGSGNIFFFTNELTKGTTPLINMATGAVSTTGLTQHVADLQGVSSSLGALVPAVTALSGVLSNATVKLFLGSLGTTITAELGTTLTDAVNGAGTAQFNTDYQALSTSLGLLATSPAVTLINTLLQGLGLSGLSNLTALIGAITSNITALHTSELDLSALTTSNC